VAIGAVTAVLVLAGLAFGVTTLFPNLLGGGGG